MRIGYAVKLIRNKRELTQGQLAEMAGLSLSYISLLERGHRDVRFSTLQKLADALEISMVTLAYIASENNELYGITKDVMEKLAYDALNG